jgi:hypothetical protein
VVDFGDKRVKVASASDTMKSSKHELLEVDLGELKSLKDS